MPRHPTGRPRGRPTGSGRLGEEGQDHARLTVRLPTDLYTRLEAFAAGRHFHRGSPQLAGCVRDALEEYLTRHTRRQTENVPMAHVDIMRQTTNGTQVPDVVVSEAKEDTRQTRNTPGAQDVISRQTENQPPLERAADDLEAMPIPPVDRTPPPACDYDATRYVLGKLCPRGHAYGETGQSLLQQSNHKCLVCHREQGRARRLAKHPAADDLEAMLRELAPARPLPDTAARPRTTPQPVEPGPALAPSGYYFGAPCKAHTHVSHGYTSGEEPQNLRTPAGKCVRCEEEKKAVKATRQALVIQEN
jgi:hypothetical protein